MAEGGGRTGHIGTLGPIFQVSLRARFEAKIIISHTRYDCFSAAEFHIRLLIVHGFSDPHPLKMTRYLIRTLKVW